MSVIKNFRELILALCAGASQENISDEAFFKKSCNLECSLINCEGVYFIVKARVQLAIEFFQKKF